MNDKKNERNAGRKPLFDEPMQRVVLNLPKSMAVFIEQNGGSKFARDVFFKLMRKQK